MHTLPGLVQREPAPLRAYAVIREMIRTLPRTADAVLNEVELAEQIGVSRTPIREAILRLVGEGIVDRLPNRGAFVAAIGDAEVGALLDASALVERWAAPLAMKRSSTGDLLREIVDRQRAAAEPPAFLDLDADFHRAIVAAAGNPIVAGFSGSLSERYRRLANDAVRASPDFVGTVLGEHERIALAFTSGDAERVLAAISGHVEGCRHAMLAA
jgi:DNA-binding GntR family transcriptional regulator